MDELTAAGIHRPGLRESYAECKRLNSLHGKTYFLATLLLPKAKRPLFTLSMDLLGMPMRSLMI